MFGDRSDATTMRLMGRGVTIANLESLIANCKCLLLIAKGLIADRERGRWKEPTITASYRAGGSVETLRGSAEHWHSAFGV